MALMTINFSPDRRALRLFGAAALVAFGALGAWVFLTHALAGFEMPDRTARLVAWVLWIAGAGCGFLATVAPRALRPLYVALSLLAFPIGFVVSFVVLAVLYYLVLTPIGLLVRLVRRDPLHLRFDPGADTYWVRREHVDDVKRYFRQF